MAAIAVVKTALVVNKQVKKRIPGGWKTVVAILLSIAVASTLLIIQGIFGMVAPFLKNGDVPVCSADPTSNNSSGNDGHDDAGSGPGGPPSAGEQWSTAGTPWPTSESANVVYPVPNPHLSSPFGYRPPFFVGGVLTPGYHNGLDFGQALGSPVLAMADGVVAGAYSGNSLYGSHVAIKHRIKGGEYTSVYGHIIGTSIVVKQGETVKAGQRIASIGSEGMSTAPHLHFVLTRGDYRPSASEPSANGGGAGNSIDPASFLSTQGAGEASGGLGGDDFSGGVEGEDGLVCKKNDGALGGDGFSSWGGHENGRIPVGMLKSIPFAGGGHRLLDVAADDLNKLNDAYRGKFGKNLVVNRAYTPYNDQGLTEVKGKSIYGWARAVQLSLAFDTPEYNWMKENASTYGWFQTSNYKQGGSGANAGIWGYVGTTESANSPAPSTPNAAANQNTARNIMRTTYPSWGPNETTCLINLWERESNWNQYADNPTSDAYGIPQSLPGEKMATMGPDWKTNPETQIKWGLNYIKERYGTPCSAWAHSEAVNWY